GGPVLAGQLPGAGGRHGGVVRTGFDLDPGGVPGPGDARTDGGPVQAPDDQRRGTAGGPPDLLDVGHGADAGVLALVAPGNQQEGVVSVPGSTNRRPRLVGLQGE